MHILRILLLLSIILKIVFCQINFLLCPDVANTTNVKLPNIKASNGDIQDRFGFSVSVSSGYAVIGSPRESSNSITTPENNLAFRSGAAYVFKLNSTGDWEEEAYLKASNIGIGYRFGESVAIDNELIVIGAPFEQSNGEFENLNPSDSSIIGAGAAYIFKRTGSSIWIEEAMLKLGGNSSSIDINDNFGYAVAISNSIVFVSAPGEDSSSIASNGPGPFNDNSMSNSGSVTVFEKNINWEISAFLKANISSDESLFGSSISVHNNIAIIGAPGESSDGTPGDISETSSGAAYVYKLITDVWVESSFIKPSVIGAGDQFGTSVSIFSDRLLIGAPLEDSSSIIINQGENDDSITSSGAAYIFVEQSENNWIQEAYIKPQNTNDGAEFGSAVSLKDEYAVIGAHKERGISGGINVQGQTFGRIDAGAVYLFQRNESKWKQILYIKAENPAEGQLFGESTSFDSSGIIIGAYGQPGFTGYASSYFCTDPCYDIFNTDCFSCISSSCFWCENTQTCSSYCQFCNGTCNDEISICPNTCSALSNCSDCTQQIGCSWCEETNTCTENCLTCPNGTCSENCIDPCIEHINCTTCSADNLGCFWCDDDKICTSNCTTCSTLNCTSLNSECSDIINDGSDGMDGSDGNDGSDGMDGSNDGTTSSDGNTNDISEDGGGGDGDGSTGAITGGVLGGISILILCICCLCLLLLCIVVAVVIALLMIFGILTNKSENKNGKWTELEDEDTDDYPPSMFYDDSD